MTWLEVIDSAVKIGLGALIAGLSALVLAKAQHRNMLAKDRAEREFQLLKETAEKIEGFTHAALKYWALSADWHRALRKDPEAKKSAQLRAAQEELFDRFNDVTTAEATLLLLGQEDAQAQLRTYGDYVGSFRKTVSNSADPLSDELINDYRTNFLRARSSLFKQLNCMYQGLGP